MKQLVAILLAALFFYTVAVHSVLLSLLIQKTKSDFFDRLQKKALPARTVVLSFSLKAGKVADSRFSIDEDGEFSYQEKMYDVLKQEIHGDRITYYCLPDDEETELRNQLTAFHLPDKQSLPFHNLHHLLKSLLQDYSLELFNFTVRTSFKIVPNTPLNFLSDNRHLSHTLHPPES